MVSQEILDSITHYIQEVRRAGIEVVTAVLFGSFAQGTATANSDIDLIIIAPEFDQRDESQVNLLWELRAFADPRIEPIACGSRQWIEDDASPILSVAWTISSPNCTWPNVPRPSSRHSNMGLSRLTKLICEIPALIFGVEALAGRRLEIIPFQIIKHGPISHTII